MLTWDAKKPLMLGRLVTQAAWYSRLIESTGIEPATENILGIERFPMRFRQHLLHALRIYSIAGRDLKCLTADILASSGGMGEGAETQLQRSRGPETVTT